MKKKKQLQVSKMQELKNGAMDGGFVALSTNVLAIFGGTEPANNCNSGNCVAGCGQGQNVVAGCGSTNGVPGCGG